MPVAIVHHWFVSLAGGERVVDAIASIFPSADVFTLFLDKQKLPPGLHNHKITTSFLDKTPTARKAHRHFLPLYPLAVEMLNLSGYDLVISSDSGPMKGVLTDPDSTHICYCHSPMRYLWDGHAEYLRSMSPLIQTVFGLASHYVRNWDYAAAQRVDHFIANSRYVAGRIQEQTADSLAGAILSFESCEEMFRPPQIQSHARKFDTSIFLKRMRNYIESVTAQADNYWNANRSVPFPAPVNTYTCELVDQRPR